MGAGTGWTYSPNDVESLLSATDNALTTTTANTATRGKPCRCGGSPRPVASPCHVVPCTLDSEVFALKLWCSACVSTPQQVRCMEQDLSWNRSAKQWEQVMDWRPLTPPTAADHHQREGNEMLCLAPLLLSCALHHNLINEVILLLMTFRCIGHTVTPVMRLRGLGHIHTSCMS